MSAAQSVLDATSVAPYHQSLHAYTVRMNPLRWLRDQLLPQRGDPQPDDLVLLGRPSGEPEAELWRNILMQWGVHCLIKNVSALAYMHSGADILQVWVLQRDEEYARELLSLGEDGTVADATPDPSRADP